VPAIPFKDHQFELFTLEKSLEVAKRRRLQMIQWQVRRNRCGRGVLENLRHYPEDVPKLENQLGETKQELQEFENRLPKQMKEKLKKNSDFIYNYAGLRSRRCSE
jgi:hypothetical protein